MTDPAVTIVFFSALLIAVCGLWGAVEAAWFVSERRRARARRRGPRASDDPTAYRGPLTVWREW